MSKNASKTSPGGAFRFRVSDSLEIPLRGHLLRLKLQEGNPSMKDLSPGQKVRVAGPGCPEREIEILGHSATGGRATQQRLAETGELELVIAREAAGTAADRVEIGWQVTGPVA